MEKILKLYTYVDGVNDTPFPSSDEQITIGSFTYTANRMGSSPTITSTVKHRLCLDDLWNDKVYAEFNGEKYYIRNTPSSSKSNTDERYEHEIELLSERDELNHVYFLDAVQGDSTVDVYKSNTTKVTFMGDIVEFVARLNSSLQYSGLSYNAVIDSGITSEDKLVSFENKYIMEALQEIFNIYELPYYFVGKTIHIGYTENAIPNVMRYGRYDALLSISKDNANYLVINRITGTGGTENIPYYYPNETDDRSQVDKWITPAQNLMPSVYRESKGANLFYNAENNKYPDGEGGYYKFDNPYSQNNILEGSVSFPEIYPTIKGMTNGSGQRIDMFSAFAYDQNDNDEIDEETNEYIHPYFFAKLRKLDGPNGFNLFDQAIEQQAMQISMTSGVCGSCTFEIGVGEETNKNIVQVDDEGNLLRDENGNVLRSGSPQARQNDTKNYEVWIALKKDDTTFPIVMPNAQDSYKPSTSDTFVILGINLPQGYITAAEDKLEQSLIKHMWMNNREKFTFSIKFSRIFFEENPTILSRLNENARLLIEYNGQQHTLYVNSFTYKMDESTPLPEIEVDLVDTLTVGSNSLQNRLDSVKQDILSSIGGADFLKQGLKYFLRKDVADTAIGFLNFLGGGMVRKDLFFGREIEGEERYKISGELGDAYLRDIAGRLFTMREGFQTDNFAAGMTGTGVGTYNKSELHMDKAVIRKYLEVLALVVAQMFYRGGRQVLSPAGMKVNRVEEGDTYWRLFMETDEGQVNEFTVGAQARVNRYGAEQRYWWRLVTGIGTDHIDVSKTDMDSGSAVPAVGDEVVQFGHRTDPYLQWVVMDSSFSDDAGTTIYAGVDSYDLSGKMVLRLGVDPQDPGRIGLFLRNGSEISEEITRIDTEIGNVSEVTEGLNEELTETRNTLNNLIQQTIPDLQNQIDGAIQSWDGSEEPTLENYPANEWTTDTEKARHVGDTYYQNTGDGLYTWKFVKNDDGTYGWQKVADSDTAALERDIRELAGIVGTKNSIHYTDNVPTPPYVINDIWIKTDGTMYTCIAQRDEGQVGGVSDWELFNDTMVRLAAMASDSVISKEEKAVLRDTWAQVQKEYATYKSQASAYGVDITGLTNAYDSLSSYLTGTVRINENTDTSLSVSQKSDYNTRWANWYSERTDFANAVAEKMADDAVDGIDIGIVNLLRDSDVELGAEGYGFGSYAETEKLTVGETYTIVICYTLGSGNTGIAPYLNNGGLGIVSSDYFRSKESRAVGSYTFTPGGEDTFGTISFFQFPQGTYGSKVHWAVLVRGNKAPNYWFPSPEDSRMGVENLVSFKRMLEWNEKNSDIAVWGQDSDGVYLRLDVSAMIQGGVAASGMSEIDSFADCFSGEIKYKANTQYVFSIEQKLSMANARGIVPYFCYTDGTRQSFYWTQGTGLNRSDFVTAKGKTVEKIVFYISNGNCDSLVYSLSLIEGNVVPLEIPTSSEDEWRSEVNLVDGGKEATIPAGSGENNNVCLDCPFIKPNTVYTVSFEDVEVLAGSPTGLSFRIVDTTKNVLYSNILNISLSDRSGLLITDNDFTAGKALLAVYPDRQDQTAGDSVKYTGVSLVEGFYPPQGWTPSQGDYENEIAEVGEALNSFKETVETTFKDGIINEGEANAIASNINMLNAEKSDVDAQYTQLYANTYLTGAAKTNLQAAKSAYDNAHTALLGAINTAISDDKITDAERADVDSKFTAYGTALGTYKTRVEEANKAIQDELNRQAQEKVDAVQIGVRNLLLKSNVEISNQETNMGSYIYSELLSKGKEYTLTLCYTLGTNATSIGACLAPGGINMSFTTHGEKVVEQKSYTIPEDAGALSSCIFYQYGATDSKIHWAVLVEGNKAPNMWIAAPEDIQAEVEAAQQAASDAQEAATAAQSDATEAKTELNQINSDSVISPVEKTALKQQQADIQAEYNEIIADAGRYGVSTTAYAEAYRLANTALTKYTAASPEYINIESDYNNIAAYYPERQSVLNSIAAAAKQAAQDAADAAKDEANGYTDAAVGGIDIGIVNLLKDSDVEISTTSVNMGKYQGIRRFEAEKEYTMVLCYTLTGDSIAACITSGDIDFSFTTKGTRVVEARRHTIPAGDNIYNYCVFYQYGTTNNIVHWAILVEGNKAPTYWFPSPEDSRMGMENLVSFKRMLEWNEKNSDIAVWGQDKDGVYLKINEGLLYIYISGVTALNDVFLGEGNYKANAQYVLSVDYRNATSDPTNPGLLLYAVYTDGTNDQIFVAGKSQTTRTRSNFVTAKGKTVQKIYATFGTSLLCLIYAISLIEGNVVPLEIPTSSEDEWRSEVNLVDGGKEATIPASTTDNYNYKALTVPVLKPNTVYTVSVEGIEVLAGSPEGFRATIYFQSPWLKVANWLTLSSGKKYGLLITTNDFSAGEGRLLLYAGINGSTAGNSVRYTGISLVEGFYPPQGWTPSQGDTRAEIEATGTETKDSFAQKLGYDSYADMKNSLSQGMITTTGMLNAKLIETEALVVTQGFVDNLTANQAFISKLDGWTFDFHSGKVGGFTIANNKLYAGADFGSGAGVHMQSLVNDYSLKVYKDSTHYVEMFYRSAGDWGIKGVDSSTIFQLGNQNKIGGFTITSGGLSTGNMKLTGSVLDFDFDDSRVYVGSRNNTMDNFTLAGGFFQNDDISAVQNAWGDFGYADKVALMCACPSKWKATQPSSSANNRQIALYVSGISRLNGIVSSLPRVWNYVQNGQIPTQGGTSIVYVQGNTGNDNPCTLEPGIDGQVIVIVNTRTDHRINIRNTSVGDHWLNEKWAGVFVYLAGQGKWYPVKD